MNGWERYYWRKLVSTDILVIFFAVFLGEALRFGEKSTTLIIRFGNFELSFPYWFVSLIVILLWLSSLALSGSRKNEILGTGTEEYRRVLRATLASFAVIALFSYLGNLQIARSYIFIALPLGLLGLWVSRRAWRQWLIKKRRRGSFLTPSVIIGSIKSADEVALQLKSNEEAGFTVLGCFLSGSKPPASESQQILLPQSRVPILGGFDSAIDTMRQIGATTLIVSNSDELSPDAVRSLGWDLAPGLENLVLAPSLLDVSGPRLHISPVAGIPLLRVETPQLSGVSRFLKRLFDVIMSLVILVVLFPLIIVVSIIIKTSSPGPVFFLQERIGLNKKPFTIYKFRTMRDGAHLEFEKLAENAATREREAGNEVQFKLQNDPRVTKIGAFLRRFSIDELPQILNVLIGQMSLVGPRPHVISEVNNYETHVMRRLLVKPGVTGLWQVSGRSTLSWEESVRADLQYVENWSLTFDFIILLKTARAVLFGDGAY